MFRLRSDGSLAGVTFLTHDINLLANLSKYSSGTLWASRRRSYRRLLIERQNELGDSKLEAMLENFPEEIGHDILFRLPIVCLVRCTSVSKAWMPIIRSSSFIHSHLNRKNHPSNHHETPQLLLHGARFPASTALWSPPTTEESKDVCCLHYDNDHDFDDCWQIDFLFSGLVRQANRRFRVAGICDGIVFIEDDLVWKRYTLWNPAIGKAVMLPWPGLIHGPFEDSVGFGFDAMANDYKVVRLVTPQIPFDYAKSPTVAEVYSLATGSWRSLGFVVPPCQIDRTRPYTYCNGAIHWTVRQWKDGHYFILALDLGSELFREIRMPKGIELHLESEVSVSGDGKSLALFTEYGDYHVDIWLMKEYCKQESWTKWISLCRQGPEKCLPRPLCFRKSGEVILALRNNERESESLVSLDTVSQQFNNLGSSEYRYCSIHSYEESLVLLDMDSAVSC
ncbi:hypothetical protein ACLB2K_025672 [Fragaria x ananassa]